MTRLAASPEWDGLEGSFDCVVIVIGLGAVYCKDERMG